LLENWAFIFAKSVKQQEDALLNKIWEMPEVKEVHLMEGEFDVLAVARTEDWHLDPRPKIARFVIDKIRPLLEVADTRTIIPAQTHTKPSFARPERRVPAFIFLQTQSGKNEDVVRDLLKYKQTREAHVLLGKWDALAVMEFEKDVTITVPAQVAKMIDRQVAKIPGVVDTETYVPITFKMR
jgi:DNA-binding Lrp family transcriptional regulator